MKRIKCTVNLIFAGLVFTLMAKAQTFQIGTPLTSGSVTFEIDSSGTFMSSGTENGNAVLTSAEQAVGTRLLWDPSKAALRAGYVSGTNWSDTNIGVYSVAFGNNPIASGPNSVAIGSGASATGPYSTAIGLLATAIGTGSFAGSTGTANGNFSFAMGEPATAASDASMALGVNTRAQSFASLVIGEYNLGKGEPVGNNPGATPSLSSWVTTDPVLEIGNGSSATPADALVVYKNGDAAFPAISSKVTAATFVTTTASGDIPMFTGN